MLTTSNQIKTICSSENNISGLPACFAGKFTLYMSDQKANQLTFDELIVMLQIMEQKTVELCIGHVGGNFENLYVK